MPHVWTVASAFTLAFRWYAFALAGLWQHDGRYGPVEWEILDDELEADSFEETVIMSRKHSSLRGCLY